MTSNQTQEPVQKILDDELDKIDAETLGHLRAARREAINAAFPETVAASAQNSQTGQLSLALHPIWQQKNWLMALALVLCLTLVLVNKNLPNSLSSDIAADFSLYSEVDPQWLMDLEIAELFADE